MADNLLLPIQVPTAPEGFCSTLGENWVQQILNLVGQSVAVLSSSSGAGTIILRQEGVPDPSQRGFLWIRPSRGSIIFSWDGGAWTALNPVPSGGIERQWVEGTPNQIWLMDGGDGSDPSIVTPAGFTGAMWDIDHNYDGRSPMGVGAIPNSYPAKTLTLSENFGEGAHTPTLTELFPHTHGPGTGADGILGHADGTVPATFNVLGGGDTIKLPTTGSAGGSAGAAVPFNVTHPIRAGYMVKRTGRTKYLAS